MVTENQYKDALDEWIADFRTEALRLFGIGVVVTDTMRIAMQVADSKANARVMASNQRSAPIELAHGRLPRA
jgi:hypothetical protein